MTTYGYMMFTFRIHPHGNPKAPLKLSALEHGGSAPKDAITLIYGVMKGLVGKQIDADKRHLTVMTVEPRGRTIRFTAEVGRSGQRSTIRDPLKPDDKPFERMSHHIDTTMHRGLIVAPSGATTGLLILQSMRRRSGYQQLAPAVKRIIRRVTGGLIVDFEALVHEEVLNDFLSQAQVNEVTLKRKGLTRDIADVMEIGEGEEDLGNLKLVIGRGRIAKFKQSLVTKLRSNSDAQNKLLRVGGLDFNELNVAMEVGDRKTTLSVHANKVPAFVYHLSRDPDDALFYKEVEEMVKEAAPTLGILLGTGWNTTKWSNDSTGTVVEVLTAEVSKNGDEPD